MKNYMHIINFCLILLTFTFVILIFVKTKKDKFTAVLYDQPLNDNAYVYIEFSKDGGNTWYQLNNNNCYAGQVKYRDDVCVSGPKSAPCTNDKQCTSVLKSLTGDGQGGWKFGGKLNRHNFSIACSCFAQHGLYMSWADDSEKQIRWLNGIRAIQTPWILDHVQRVDTGRDPFYIYPNVIYKLISKTGNRLGVKLSPAVRDYRSGNRDVCVHGLSCCHKSDFNLVFVPNNEQSTYIRFIRVGEPDCR